MCSDRLAFLIRILVFVLLFLGGAVGFAQEINEVSLDGRTYGPPVLVAKKAKKAKKGESKTAIAPLPTPTQSESKTYSFFTGIDSTIIKDVEIGSPASLKRALTAIHKSEIDYTESERVLVATAQTLLKMVYPKEYPEGTVISCSTQNPYMGALQSAQNSVFDTSTGNADFLAVMLPAVVIVKKSSVASIYADALQSLQMALSMNSKSVIVHYLLAILYMKNSDLDSAAFEYEQAKTLAPDSFSILYSYCGCLSLLGRTKEANAIITSLVGANPTSIDLLKMAADTSFSLKNYGQADEYITRVLQQDPNDLPSLLFRIKILFQKKDYARAASLLDIYSRQDSSAADYLILRCQLQYDWSHSVNSALATLDEALRLYPNDPKVQLLAARLASETASKIGGKDGAEYASLVLQKEPNNIDALIYSIDTLMQAGDYKKAYEISNKIVGRGGNVETTALLRHVAICVKSGRAEEAMNIITPLYKENSGDEDIVQTYIVALSELGYKAAALNLINDLLGNAAPKMKSFLYYRRSLLQVTTQEGINDLRSSLMSNPRNADALFRLYKIYYDTHDYRKAQYYLRQVVALNPNNEEYQRLNAELNKLNQ